MAIDHEQELRDGRARVAALDEQAEALGIDVRLAVTSSHGNRAIRHLLNGDGDSARRLLGQLDDEQLLQLARAAAVLVLLASEVGGGELPTTTRETGPGRVT